MPKICLIAITLAYAASLSHAAPRVISEDFSSNPLPDRWRIFGDADLFQWDPINQNLQVTWDSSKENSYFYQPINTILTREDDFSIAFDLLLDTIGAGADTNKSASFPIAISFLNLDIAAGTNFARGAGSDSPDLDEIDYFWDSGFGATLWPTFVDTNSAFNYNNANDFALFSVKPGDWYHFRLNFTATNQTAVLTVTNFQQTSGVMISQLLNTNFGDYRLASVSISSYSDAGQDPQYAGSVFAHGVVDNLTVTVPPAPVQNLVGSVANELWQVQFLGQSNWLYTLEETFDFRSWSRVSSTLEGVTANMVLVDTNPPSAAAYYRVRADRP